MIEMSMRTQPVSFEKINPLEEKFLARQTGWRQLHIFLLRMASHSSASDTPVYLTDLMELPTAVTGYGNYTDLKLANPSTWTFNKDQDFDEMPLWKYLIKLVAQSETYMLGWSKMVDMYVDKSTVIDAATSVELFAFYDEMYNALTSRPPLLLDDGGAAPSDLADALQSLDWIFAANTKEAHRDWMRRFMIMLGYLFRPLLPKFNERFESMDDKQIQRVVMTFVCAAAEIMADFIIAIAPAQTERAIANMLFLDRNRLSIKVPSEFETSIDALWGEIVRTKFAETMPTGHTQFTAEYVDTSLVNNVTTLDDYIVDSMSEYPVCDYALKWGRQMFGIGKTTRLKEEIHFAVLFDITGHIDTEAMAADDWVNIYNYSTKLYAFSSLPIVIKYLRDRRERRNIWNKALKNRRHWTYDDIESFADKLFSNFSMTKSLEGRCEDAAYPGLRATVFDKEGEYAVPLDYSEFADPTKMVSTNNMKATILDATLADRPCAPWVYPYLMQLKYCDPKYVIWLSNTWSEVEFEFWIRWGMLLSRAPESTPLSGQEDYCRIHCVQYHMVEFVDARTKEFVALMTSNAEQIRFESLENVHSDTYDATAMKYGCTCVQIKPDSVVQIVDAARLKGIDGESSIIIRGLAGDVDNCQNFLAKCWGNPPSGASKGVLLQLKAAAPPATSTPPSAKPPPSLPDIPPSPTDAADLKEE